MIYLGVDIGGMSIKVGAVDERVLKEAEDLLCGELAAALDTERDAVRAQLEPAR